MVQKIIGENSVYNCNEGHKVLFKEKCRTHLKKCIQLIERSQEFNKVVCHVPAGEDQIFQS